MKPITLFILIILFFLTAANATAIPSTTTSAGISVTGTLSAEAAIYISKLKIKEIQKLTGRKLTIKEKIAFKIFQWKIRKAPGDNRGKRALTFALIGLCSLIIPVIGILSCIVFSIMALIWGYQAKKEDPEDRNARNAIVLGWVNLGIIILAILIVIALLTSWTLSFG